MKASPLRGSAGHIRRIEPREAAEGAFCGRTISLRASTVVARQWEGRNLSRERETLHMKSGRALEQWRTAISALPQLPAMRDAGGKTAVFCGMLVVMLLCASDVYGQAATRPAARPSVVSPARADPERDGP